MVPEFGVSAECQSIGTSGNDSYLRACMKLRIVEKIRFSLLESGRTKAWCPGLVSRPSAKCRNQWQEVEGSKSRAI